MKLLKRALGGLTRVQVAMCDLVGGVDRCLLGLVDAWAKQLTCAALNCAKCGLPHLDEKAWVKEHYLHVC